MERTEARRGALLLEREAEIEALEGALARAREGSGALVLVDGHAGTGKTSLVEATTQRALAAGMDVLRARGAEVEQAFSFGVMLQLLERRVADAKATERKELLSGAADLARPLLEGRAVGAGPEAVFPTQHGLYWLISNLADRAPLLLCVDDAHWADGASLRFLASLVHRLEGLPLALVLTRRLGEPGAEEGALAGVAVSQLATVLRLRPLSGRAVAELVRARYDESADEDFCRACAEAAGGNPLYVDELLVELERRGTPARADQAESVPRLDSEELARSIGTRLERAGRDATALAEAASVVEGGLPVRLVRQLAGLEHDPATVAAQMLADAEILTPEDPLRFVHPLVRRALYGRLPQRRRAQLHRRTASLLRDEHAEPERIAGHLQLGDTRGEEWATHVLVRAAGSATERGAPEAAAGYLRRALEEGPPEGLRPTIIAQLGIAEVASGEFQAVERVRKAAAMTNDAVARARYLMLANQVLYYLGRYDEVNAFGRQAAAELGDQDEELADEIAAYGVCSIALITAAEPEALARVQRAARRISQRSFGPQTFGERLVLVSLASWGGMTGQLPAERVRALAQLAIADAPGEQLRSAMNQGPMALRLAGAYEDAEMLLGRALEDARRRGFVHHFMVASWARGQVRQQVGSLLGAIADAEAALGIAKQGLDGFEPEIRATLGLCLLDCGDIEGARQALDLPDQERWSGQSLLAQLPEARGHLQLTTGEAAAARGSFLEARSIVDRFGAHNPASCAWRSGMALAERALGNGDEALRLAAEEVELARAFGAPRALGVALRAQGLVLGGDEGLHALDEAVEVLEPSGARLEHARALLDRGAAKRRARQRAAARDDIRKALDLALQCDAPGLAARARAELGAAGGKPRRERVSGPAALTPQERRVANMASEGLTNRQIAEALFLTKSTIESHLRSIFMKLDIDSRGQLAEALRDDSGPDA